MNPGKPGKPGKLELFIGNKKKLELLTPLRNKLFYQLFGGA